MFQDCNRNFYSGKEHHEVNNRELNSSSRCLAELLLYTLMDLMIQMSLTKHLQRDADRLDIMKNIIHSFEMQIFALRRGGSRHETLCVVSCAMRLLGRRHSRKTPLQGKRSQTRIQGKRSSSSLTAGIIQSLLSTWSRVHYWPEIEKQLLKVIE